MIERASSSVSSAVIGSSALGRTRPSTRRAGGAPALINRADARSRIASSSNSWTLTTSPSPGRQTRGWPLLYHFVREATKGSRRIPPPGSALTVLLDEITIRNGGHRDDGNLSRGSERKYH